VQLLEQAIYLSLRSLVSDGEKKVLERTPLRSKACALSKNWPDALLQVQPQVEETQEMSIKNLPPDPPACAI